MNILELCLSNGFGGLELYVLKISNNVFKPNVKLSFIARKDSFLSKKLAESNIESDFLSSSFRHFPIVAAFKLGKYIDKNEIDVLHIHWGNDLFLAVLAKKFCKRNVKLVYTRHMALTRTKYDFYHQFLYKHVDAYIAITKEVYKEAIGYLPIDVDKIQLVYHGVQESECHNDCQSYIRDSGMDENVFRLVIFGRVEEGKGQHFVLDAVNELRKQGTNIQLAIIGHIMDEMYYKNIQSYISKNKLESNVFYLGFHENPTSIMPCFDAVVLATKSETFGLVLPEAMRAGVAVIGSNSGGVPEIIEHEKTGLLFESENVSDLTKQLARIIQDNSFCKTLALAGKKDADKRFSEEEHFNKLTKVFESA